MIDVIYVEGEVADHPRARAVYERFPEATVIPCERYTEVFNPTSQNFRLQKRRPALIVARKHGGYVLEAPQGYAVGGQRNYYFSHMMNCIYDCRYCFLQGMYRSAHYVWFINYEDFEHAISQTLERAGSQPTWFFAGYDCDSLAFEPITHFVGHFVPFFAGRSDAYVELRTKSTQIRSLLRTDPSPNVIVAFSFTPGPMAHALEHKVPAVGKRIAAMSRLQQAGWKVGLRFDPLIYQENYKEYYRVLFRQIFCSLDGEGLHSVSFGSFRLPRPYFKRLVRLYPEEPLFAGRLEEDGGMVSYGSGLEEEMIAFCREELALFVPEERLFPCVASL